MLGGEEIVLSRCISILVTFFYLQLCDLNLRETKGYEREREGGRGKGGRGKLDALIVIFSWL